jgi:hypothetical protein
VFGWLCRAVKGGSMKISPKAKEYARKFIESPYGMNAPGYRFVGKEEVELIFHTIIDTPEDSLTWVHDHHPQSIEMSKSSAEMSCQKFNQNCDCFLPDQIGDMWCVRERNIAIQNSDRRNYPEYDIWRTAVFERDNFTCEKCGKRGGEIEAHHIKSYKKYPELRLDVDNGMTLCKQPCHKEEHRRGKKID